MNLLNSIVTYLQSDVAETFLKNGKLAAEIFSILIGTCVGLGSLVITLWKFNEERKEKRIHETFSYFSQLRTRLCYMRQALESIQTELTSRLLVSPKNKNAIESTRVDFVTSVCSNLSVCATDLLKYLKETEAQYPAGKGWSVSLDKLLDFLFYIEHISTDSTSAIYLWNDESDDIKKQQFDEYIDAISNMINMIIVRQSKLEKILFPSLRFTSISPLKDNFNHNRECSTTGDNQNTEDSL